MVNNTQYLTGGKSPNPLEPPSNFLASPGNAKVTLTWTDPHNATVEPSGQTYATWAYTQVVRKEGSQPTGPNDGTVVVQSSVRDQYAANGFVDTGLTNNTLYYYGAFAYNSDGVYSEGAFVSATPVAGTPLGNIAVGTLIKTTLNGAPWEFRVVNQGLPSDMYDESCDGTWVLINNIYITGNWNISVSYLNGAFLELFDSGIRNLIKEVKIPYLSQTGGSIANLTCKAFLLSPNELGLSQSYDSYIPNDGAKLAYFDSGESTTANSKRVAQYNGSTYRWITRSLYNNKSYPIASCWIVDLQGTCAHDGVTETAGLRPALIFPKTVLIDQDLNLMA